MARMRIVRPLVIASFVVLGGVLAAPGGASLSWGAAYEQPQQKKPAMQAPETATPRTAAPQPTPMPTTSRCHRSEKPPSNMAGASITTGPSRFRSMAHNP